VRSFLEAQHIFTVDGEVRAFRLMQSTEKTHAFRLPSLFPAEQAQLRAMFRGQQGLVVMLPSEAHILTQDSPLAWEIDKRPIFARAFDYEHGMPPAGQEVKTLFQDSARRSPECVTRGSCQVAVSFPLCGTLVAGAYLLPLLHSVAVTSLATQGSSNTPACGCRHEGR
jgi:hypothetical protein